MGNKKKKINLWALNFTDQYSVYIITFKYSERQAINKTTNYSLNTDAISLS